MTDSCGGARCGLCADCCDESLNRAAWATEAAFDAPRRISRSETAALTAAVCRVYDIPLAAIEGYARDIHGFEGDDS